MAATPSTEAAYEIAADAGVKTAVRYAAIELRRAEHRHLAQARCWEPPVHVSHGLERRQGRRAGIDGCGRLDAAHAHRAPSHPERATEAGGGSS